MGALSQHYEALSVEASKQTTAEEIVSCIVERLTLPVSIIYYRVLKYYSKHILLVVYRVTTMNSPKWLANVRSVGFRPTRSPCQSCCCGPCTQKEILIGNCIAMKHFTLSPPSFLIIFCTFVDFT